MSNRSRILDRYGRAESMGIPSPSTRQPRDLSSPTGTPSGKGSVNPRTGYDRTANYYRSPFKDPYDDLAEHYRQMGRRQTHPYEMAATEALQVGLREKVYPYVDLGNPRAVAMSASVGGSHQTYLRTFGRQDLPTDISLWWDARRQEGFRESGNRDGFSTEYDYSEANRRRSGRLIPVVGPGPGIAPGPSLAQHVYPDRPYLMLRGSSGSMTVRITAGVSDGGAESVRTFVLGGGWTAQFYLPAYDAVTIEMTEFDPDAVLQFAWLEQGMQAGDQTLYLPQNIFAPFGLLPVPEGAFEVVAETADPGWIWSSPILPGYAITGLFPNPIRNLVAGSKFTPTVANHIVWSIRPI